MRSRFESVLALSLVLAASAGPRPALAIDGDLDPTFSGDGRMTVHFPSSDSHDGANAVAVQPDGKIVLGGSLAWSNTDTDFAFVRLNPDGSLDTTFGGGTGRVGIAFDDGPSGHFHDEVTDVVIQPDGKILACGLVEVGDGESEFHIGVVRLLPSGALDPSFMVDGEQVYWPGDSLSYTTRCKLALRPTGEIVLLYSSPGATNLNAGLLQLVSGGPIDGFFGDSGYYRFPCAENVSLSCELTALALLPGGTVAVTGNRISMGGEVDVLYARINEEGTNAALDWFDAPGANSADTGFGLAVESDGDVILGFTTWAGLPTHYTVRFVDNDVTIDPTYGTSGFASAFPASTGAQNIAYAEGVLTTGDGRALVYGWVHGQHALVRRLTPGGSPDPTFGIGGDAVIDIAPGTTEDRCFDAALDGGRVVTAGLATVLDDLDFAAARLQENLIFRDGFEIGSAFLWSR